MLVNLISVAIHGEIPVVGVGFFAEATLPDFGVQCGKKQVLQYRAVVGIPSFTLVIFQQSGNFRFVEQLVRDQSLLLDEPDEQQARD